MAPDYQKTAQRWTPQGNRSTGKPKKTSEQQRAQPGKSGKKGEE